MKRPLFCAVLLAGSLAGCNTTPKPVEPVIQIQRVEVPVPVYCKADIGEAPLFADSDEALAAAPNILEAMRLRVIGRTQRINWSRLQDAALAACQPPQP